MSIEYKLIDSMATEDMERLWHAAYGCGEVAVQGVFDNEFMCGIALRLMARSRLKYAGGLAQFCTCVCGDEKAPP